MKNQPHDFSPYLIGMTQFPDESGPDFFIQDPYSGKILNYFETYELAVKEAMRLKNAPQS